MAEESPTFTLTINGERRTVACDGDTPLLWVLRDELGLTGTKFGCGRAQCGACTVFLGGKAIRSCVFQVESVAAGDQDVTTIEGLSGDVGAAVQHAWRSFDVPQCGYCQSGQVMSATALLESNPKPDDAAIDRAMSGNICRCATYERVRKAIHEASDTLATARASGREVVTSETRGSETMGPETKGSEEVAS